MIAPEAAPVRPRIVSPDTGDALLLEDFVFTKASQLTRGSISLVGPCGSGKTTALRHLAAKVLPFHPIVLLDEPDHHLVKRYSQNRLVIYTNERQIRGTAGRRLAPWSEDDLIEYLLAKHPEHASVIFSRLRESSDQWIAAGSPELWRIVIDEMAANTSLHSVASVIRAVVKRECITEGNPDLASDHCVDAIYLDLITKKRSPYPRPKSLHKASIEKGSKLWRLVRYPAVRNLVCADKLSSTLARCQIPPLLNEQLSSDLIREIGTRICSDRIATEHLRNTLAQHANATPMLASILHAAGVDWQPIKSKLNLAGGFFSGADWSGIDLDGTFLDRAQLNETQFSHSSCKNVIANSTEMRGANLLGASLTGCSFKHSDLTEANFQKCQGEVLRFTKSKLVGADFSEANLHKPRFDQADLSGASFFKATLVSAIFLSANIVETDFHDANLLESNFQGLCLRKAYLERAKFVSCRLKQCDLEDIGWEDAVFENCDLRGSYLTGSVFPMANFCGADLTGAGLGDVIWEGADLRAADLTGCSFHMGSTRCGLVDSPYPSHGTRTGFYTDDYEDKYFKPAEEIRKASLRGANLTGAKVSGVDFYLVDLRDAIYDVTQLRQFVRTGAIL